MRVSSQLVLLCVLAVGCSNPAAAILRAARGTSADTPMEAVTEGQTGSPALENDLRSPASTSLGAEVSGVACDATAEDRAYCDGNSYVECDAGDWRSLGCPEGQYCGELDNAVGCYSNESNDPDVTPDPEPEDDAAQDEVDASMPLTCGDVAGTYNVRETSPTGCSPSEAIEVTQSNCMVTLTGIGSAPVTLTMNDVGTTNTVSDVSARFDFSSGVTITAGDCTIMASR